MTFLNPVQPPREFNAICPNVNKPTWPVFQNKRSRIRARQRHFTNSYYKLDIFLEHKLFTKHCYLLRLLFLNIFIYSVVYYFSPRRPKYNATQLNPQGCSQGKGGGGVNDCDSQNGHNFLGKKLQILKFYALSICDGFNCPCNTQKPSQQ